MWGCKPHGYLGSNISGQGESWYWDPEVRSPLMYSEGKQTVRVVESQGGEGIENKARKVGGGRCLDHVRTLGHKTDLGSSPLWVDMHQRVFREERHELTPRSRVVTAAYWGDCTGAWAKGQDQGESRRDSRGEMLVIWTSLNQRYSEGEVVGFAKRLSVGCQSTTR